MKLRKLFTSLALVMALTFALTSCGPNAVHDLKVDLNKAAAVLNTAAKENRTLYEQKVFGARALDIRRKIATAIHAANEEVIVALDVAKGITPASFTGDKVQILTLLGQAVTELATAHVGDNRLDVLLQAAAASINSAIIVITALQSVEMRRQIVNELNKQLASLGNVRRYSLADMGGF